MNKYLLTATVLLSGCAPLQQAPLVYTSKQVLGIDISAPTTESAGISLNVGFKNIDAAYVPVAVSKVDGEAAGQITPIYATYGEGRRLDQPKVATEIKQPIEKLAQTLETKQQEVAVLDTAKIQILQQAPINRNEPRLGNENILKQLSQVVSLPPEIKNKLEANQPLSAKEADKTIKTIDKKSETAKAELVDARKEIAEAFDKSKTDAMSVFGSFDSGAKGDKTAGVSHNLGKIFSTGVAAQHLTEGLQKYAVFQQCLDLIKNSETAQKTALITLCTNLTGSSVAQAQPVKP